MCAQVPDRGLPWPFQWSERVGTSRIEEILADQERQDLRMSRVENALTQMTPEGNYDLRAPGSLHPGQRGSEVNHRLIEQVCLVRSTVSWEKHLCPLDF